MGDLIIRPASSGSLKIQDQAGTAYITTGTSSGLTLGSAVTFPAGHIIQTQFTQLTTSGTQSFSADTDVAVDGMTVNITPLFNNSIIKLESYLMLEYSSANDMDGSIGFFFRDSTALGNTDSTAQSRKIGVGTGSLQYFGSDSTTTPENYNLTFFDRPNDGTNAIAQITYKFGINADNGGTLYINRSVNDSNHSYAERGCSYISATEIAQSGTGSITSAKTANS